MEMMLNTLEGRMDIENEIRSSKRESFPKEQRSIPAEAIPDEKRTTENLLFHERTLWISGTLYRLHKSCVPTGEY